MPNCGSQVVLCDIPIRFDTYSGCSHGCQYCFVSHKGVMSGRAIRPEEGVKALVAFIHGKRTKETIWCDWNIPLHWGGVKRSFPTSGSAV